MPQRILAFLDTTEWFEDSTMSRPGWDSLRSATVKHRLRIATSEISVKELVRQVHERVDKYNQSSIEARRKLLTHVPHVPAFEPASADSYEFDLRKRLDFAQVEVVPLPSALHEDVITRDISGRKPFNRSGKGYRDTLIWLSFLDWASRSSTGRGGPLYFVSANRNDFAGHKANQLHEDLVADLPVGVDVIYLERLSDLVRVVRESGSDISVPTSERAPQAAEATGLTVFSDLVGFPIDDLPVQDPYIDFPPIHEGRITAIELIEDDVEAELVDSFDTVGIWTVTCTAWMRIEGQVYADDARTLPTPWIIERDPEPISTVRISAWLECTLGADVRVDADGNAVDGAVIGAVFKAPRR